MKRLLRPYNRRSTHYYGTLFMTYNPDIHHRRSIRLRDYDYASGGVYFVTICTWERECLFGEVSNGEKSLNGFGATVAECWQAIASHFPSVELDEYVIMPNHVHAILHMIEFGVVGAKQGLSASPGFGNNSPGFDLCSKNGEAGESLASPLRNALSLPHGTVQGSLGAVIQNFKSISTRKLNKLRSNAGCPVWQRNYYERVIRNDDELTRAREYIVNNPLKWELDKKNPANQN